MHRKLARAFLILGPSLILAAMPARAQVTEIYKCYDENGRPLYTSDKRDTRGKKCELVSREINVVPAPPSRKAGGFPKESATDRANAKGRQREILEKELTSEQQLLAKAQKELAEQESIRTGDERNYARVLERLQPFKDSVETHQKNIEALKRELSNLYR
ncbi:MAG: hypothetical protein A3G28_00965 [Betaproteobacteria bacterium RIFCSPLOWO2_12_FULL_68_19]|nr:MAG: hypothetical protein A3G28_00965 [Betaproteobacteria bacterium RIFCSPLOWO2_12_FULL_68_19]